MLKPEESRWIAFFTSLIFLAHPLQTQPVNYIIQRAALLAAFFYLSSLVLYMKARSTQRQKRPMWKIYYMVSIFAAVLSMLSKETAVSLPLMVCCYEFCFLKNSEKFNWKMVSPFLLFLLLVPFVFMPLVGFTDISRTVHDFSGGVGPIQYFLTQLRVKMTYLRLLVLPLGQHVEYDCTGSKSIFEIPVMACAVFLGFVLYLAFRMFRNFKLMSFGIFWFFITLLPESSFWPNRDLIFEHRLYLPMLGFGLFVSSGSFRIFGPRHTKFTVGLFSLLVLCYSVLTYNRNKVWLDELTLWDDAVHQAPGNERSYLNRGAAFYNLGKLDKALADYIKALQIDPHDFVTYSDLGLIYMDKGDYNMAIFEFGQAIKINPNYAGAYNNRARAYDKKGDLDKAMADYTKAIQVKSDYAAAYNNRGIDYDKQGRTDLAMADYDQAIKVDPDYPETYNNRGIAYQKTGHLAEALNDFSKAIALKSNSAIAYYNRAALYQRLGNLDQALFDYSKVTVLDINYAAAYNNRGIIYALKGQLDKASSDYRKALSIDPHFTAAYKNLEHLNLILKEN
jgi:tetratricopeptide (TPR) repeat protein